MPPFAEDPASMKRRVLKYRHLLINISQNTHLEMRATVMKTRFLLSSKMGFSVCYLGNFL
jgi:hypothetical protein